MNHSVPECKGKSKEEICLYVSLSKHQKREVGTARMKIENGVKKPNSIHASIQNSAVLYIKGSNYVSPGSTKVSSHRGMRSMKKKGAQDH